MIIRAFITHKIGEYFADCQDRFSVSKDTKSIAVSDGMGSTWQQKIWAELLVESFTNNPEWNPDINSVKLLSPIWRNRVQEFIQKLKDDDADQSIIIRNERNFAEGYSAGATFVGIRFTNNNWNGFVLGDSCLIKWDGNEAKFFTSQEVDSFNCFPDYFDSNDAKDGIGTIKEISGELNEGNYVFLVSDPFSNFLLEHNKKGDISSYVNSLLRLNSHEEFENLVSEWRAMGMDDDDATLVVVEYDSNSDFSIPAIDDISLLIKVEKETLELQQNKDLDHSEVRDNSENSIDNPSHQISNMELKNDALSVSATVDEQHSASNEDKVILFNQISNGIKELVRNKCLQKMLISLIKKIM